MAITLVLQYHATRLASNIRATFIVIQSEVKPEPIVTRRTRFPALRVSYMYSLRVLIGS